MPSYSVIRRINFYPRWSLSGTFPCCTHFYVLHRLNSLHELSIRSWTLIRDTWLTPDSVMQIISKLRLCLLSYWSPFGSAFGVGLVCPSHLWNGWVPVWDGLFSSLEWFGDFWNITELILVLCIFISNLP